MKLFANIGIGVLYALLYSLLYPMFKKVDTKVPPFTLMAISMFTLFFWSFLASVFFEKSLQTKGIISKENVLILVLAGTINLAAFWVLLLGQRNMPIWQITMFNLLVPVFAGIASYFILGEQLNPKMFIGLAIMAVGLFVAIK